MKKYAIFISMASVLGLALVASVVWGIMNGQGSPPTESGQQGQQQQQQQSLQPVMKHLITIKTSLGDIAFATYDEDAPLATNNFITLAEKGFYNGVIFHRVIKGFMIQGGDPTGTGAGGPGYTFKDELDPSTPSYKNGYVTGVVAMANAGPNTNGSQFFIMLATTSLPHLYTIFGKVVSGQSVVDAIGNLPVDQNDRPLNPPVMESVTVAPYAPNSTP